MLGRVSRLFETGRRLIFVGFFCLLIWESGQWIAEKPRVKQQTVTNILFETVQAQMINWPKETVNYYLRNIDIRDLFAYMSNDLGVKIVVSEILHGVTNLDLQNGSMKDIFLDVIEDLNAIFYFDGDAIYIYHRGETQQANIRLSQITVEDFLAKLKILSIYDSKFVFQKIDDYNLNIFGPPRYLQAVKEVVNRIDAPRKVVVQYFPLQHALAADKKVDIRGEEILIEGVATILRSLVQKNDDDNMSESSKTWLSNEQIQQGLRNLGGSYIGQITYDSRSNAIIVKDYVENMATYANLISMIDKSIPMIEIVVSIVDVDTNYTQALGINWDLNVRGREVSEEEASKTQGSFIENLARMFKGSILPKNQAISILSRIRMMENRGHGRVISRPSVLTKNNTQATLDYTNTFMIPSGGKDSHTTQNIVTGVLLKVTPRVSVDDAGQQVIHLDVVIEDSNINSQEILKSGVPRISKTSINTSAQLQAGTTFVIGGYYHEIGAYAVDQVPILSRLPMVGELFKMRDRNLRKFERIFFIIPSIVKPN